MKRVFAALRLACCQRNDDRSGRDNGEHKCGTDQNVMHGQKAGGVAMFVTRAWISLYTPQEWWPHDKVEHHIESEHHYSKFHTFRLALLSIE